MAITNKAVPPMQSVGGGGRGAQVIYYIVPSYYACMHTKNVTEFQCSTLLAFHIALCTDLFFFSFIEAMQIVLTV